MRRKKEILVYAHWKNLGEPVLMGTLTSTPGKGKEAFSFEYTKKWLASGFTQMIDPDLQFYSGRYFAKEEKQNFGVFLDSCPDRWGRVLMARKEAFLARLEKRAEKHLDESDFLLGVYDGHRIGALRFKLAEEGPFQNDDSQMAAPPFTSLSELEQASKRYEEDNTGDEDYLKWINLLIAPGSSLGGARPKASVLDPKNQLWIAKFPSIKDTKNMGGWEMVANTLARTAGINVAEGDIKQYNHNDHTFLTKRFDRNENGERIHFASAMTMLGYMDVMDSHTGVSYLDIVEFLIKHGADVNTDLEELWRRIIFYICIKNTDDHLRNHGFLLTEKGWRLSPAFDINPNEYGTGLSLNISETDNALDLELALTVINYFRIPQKTAHSMIDQVKDSVSQWKIVAKEIGLPNAELQTMKNAFITS